MADEVNEKSIRAILKANFPRQVARVVTEQDDLDLSVWIRQDGETLTLYKDQNKNWVLEVEDIENEEDQVVVTDKGGERWAFRLIPGDEGALFAKSMRELGF